jgi:hypothetical protein
VFVADGVFVGEEVMVGLGVMVGVFVGEGVTVVGRTNTALVGMDVGILRVGVGTTGI